MADDLSSKVKKADKAAQKLLKKGGDAIEKTLIKAEKAEQDISKKASQKINKMFKKRKILKRK
jgi:uroporphyrinogen-III synthase